jgi:hypothetical protein
MTLDEAAEEITRCGYPIGGGTLLKLERAEIAPTPELLDAIGHAYRLTQLQRAILDELAGRAGLQVHLARVCSTPEPPSKQLIPLLANGELSSAEFEAAVDSWFELACKCLGQAQQSTVAEETSVDQTTKRTALES